MQVRWAAVLAQWLPKIKTKVTISVPWRPFYENIKAAYVDPMTSFHGERPCWRALKGFSASYVHPVVLGIEGNMPAGCHVGAVLVAAVHGEKWCERANGLVMCALCATPCPSPYFPSIRALLTVLIRPFLT